MTKEQKEETITISKGEYDTLKDRYFWSECLYNHGVDNWSGYPDAMSDYENPGEATNEMD